MTSSVEYKGDLRTVCTHLRSGSTIETDAPVDNNGKGERFSPTDMLATSLATCMLTTMGIKARKLGFDLAGMRMEVLKTMKPDPRRVAAIDLKAHIPSALHQLSREQQATLIETAHNCPVQHSIHPDVEVKVDWAEWEP